MKPFDETVQIHCDVLVIGGGGTGLSAAVTARRMGADVIVASKARMGYANNTFIAAGMISSTGWGDANDTPDAHLRDMMIAGRYVNDSVLASVVTQNAHDHVPFLEGCGVNFLQKDGATEAVKFPGHSFPRNVRAAKRNGKEYMLPLVKYATGIGVRFFDHTLIVRLFSEENRISAALGFDRSGTLFQIQAKSIILATGGFAQAYQNTNNAFGITGDGYALAYEMGVGFRDMEFVQFYPTWGTFYEITIATAGAGLKNSKGEDILEKHGFSDPGSITRDELSIAVFSEIQQGLDVDGGVLVDYSSVPEDMTAMLSVFLPNAEADGDMTRVVKPVAHFCMGGVMVDEKAMTSVDGLFAAGEICGGAHGANRLGGNALAEVFSMGRIAGRYASEYAQKNNPIRLTDDGFDADVSRLKDFIRGKGGEIKRFISSLKQTLWGNAGIIRNRKSLENALSDIEAIETAVSGASVGHIKELMRYMELKNMLTVSKILCRSALVREESRGSHYRDDFPEEDNVHWLKNIIVRKENEDMMLEVLPVDREVFSKLNIEI
jgi:succinate dehydrogenase/fumarate reductase flavoprotein subunit